MATNKNRKSARARKTVEPIRRQPMIDHTDSAALAKRLHIDMDNKKNPINAGMIKNIMDSMQLDHWQNRQTGLGVRGQDKRMAGNVGYTTPFREIEVEEILTADPIARRLVELPIKDALRKGFEINTKNVEAKKAILLELKRLQVIHQMKMAAFYARTYGGAGCLMSVDDGLPLDKPLDLRRIRRFNAIIPLTRWELWTNFTDLERNINNPNFNYPAYYRLQPRRGLPFELENVTPPDPQSGQVENVGTMKFTLPYNTKIHASRIIRFDGKWLPIRKRASNIYWDDSIFTSLWIALRDFAESHGYLSSIVADFSMAVMKIKAFSSLLSGEGNDGRVEAMLETMALFRNLMGAVVCGPDDSYTWENRSVAGLGDVVDRIDKYFQACVDVPATKLFNMSPSGMNATGGYEDRQWNMEVEWHQTDYWTPKFDRLFEVIQSAKFGPTKGVILPDFSYEWLPLEQQDPKEEAVTRKTIADTDALYNDMSGGTIAEEILKQRFGGDRFNKNLKLENITIKEPEPEPAPGTAEEKTADAILSVMEIQDVSEAGTLVATDENIAKELDEMNKTKFEERLPRKYLDVAPPGFGEKKMAALKSAKGVTNAFALAWYLHGKGYDGGK